MIGLRSVSLPYSPADEDLSAGFYLHWWQGNG
jgi:hypothetical protein